MTTEKLRADIASADLDTLLEWEDACKNYLVKYNNPDTALTLRMIDDEIINRALAGFAR